MARQVSSHLIFYDKNYEGVFFGKPQNFIIQHLKAKALFFHFFQEVIKRNFFLYYFEILFKELY